MCQCGDVAVGCLHAAGPRRLQSATCLRLARRSSDGRGKVLREPFVAPAGFYARRGVSVKAIVTRRRTTVESVCDGLSRKPFGSRDGFASKSQRFIDASPLGAVTQTCDSGTAVTRPRVR